MSFIRQQKMGFQALEPAEFEELRPLLVKVEQSIGNRDFAAHLQQGAPTDAFFKVPCCSTRSQLMSQSRRGCAGRLAALFGRMQALHKALEPRDAYRHQLNANADVAMPCCKH